MIAVVDTSKAQRVAAVVAGIAGAARARTLTRAGHSVHLFDKLRGPGRRRASRRIDWVDRQEPSRWAMWPTPGVVDTRKFPEFVAGQNRSNCALLQGQRADKSGGCPVFAGKQLARTGWCSAWAKKA